MKSEEGIELLARFGDVMAEGPWTFVRLYNGAHVRFWDSGSDGGPGEVFGPEYSRTMTPPDWIGYPSLQMAIRCAYASDFSVFINHTPRRLSFSMCLAGGDDLQRTVLFYLPGRYSRPWGGRQLSSTDETIVAITEECVAGDMPGPVLIDYFNDNGPPEVVAYVRDCFR